MSGRSDGELLQHEVHIPHHSSVKREQVDSGLGLSGGSLIMRRMMPVIVRIS